MNGVEALELLSSKSYDAVVLDVNMPKMDGITLLSKMREKGIQARVLMNSTDTDKGTKVTLEALELGALDFVHKPVNSFRCRNDEFVNSFLLTLEGVCEAKLSDSSEQSFSSDQEREDHQKAKLTENTKLAELVSKKRGRNLGRKLVAIASSTGGPKALQSLIPYLPKELDAPILLVQHMPKGFTSSMANRLDSMSSLKVQEAAEGMTLQKGHVYVSQGGMHMTVQVSETGAWQIHYTDEPPREGVKPCANYMFESIRNIGAMQTVCVVLTGMGADGTAGVKALKEAEAGKVHVIAQNEESCVVYGMPKMIQKAGLVDQVVSLEKIAGEITMQIGRT